MSDGVHIRAARPGDAGEIAALIREAFSPAFGSMFIYACPRVDRYVREQIRARAHGGDTRYTVAVAQGHVVGCSEMRRLPTELFSNYLAVAPAFRGAGLGTRLLRAAIEDARDGRTALSLDVHEDNRAARQWYARLGVAQRSVTRWWVLPLGGSAAHPALLADWPQACACRRAFGFSQFRCVTVDGEYRMGMLGAEWFVVKDREALLDAAARATLARIDPARRILALLPDGGLPPALAGTATAAAASIRMGADLPTLLQRLREGC